MKKPVTVKGASAKMVAPNALAAKVSTADWPAKSTVTSRSALARILALLTALRANSAASR